MLPTKICYNFYPFSPWSSHNGQVLVVLMCLAESLSFISSSIKAKFNNYHQKWMAKSRRVWCLLRTPHWLARVKAKKSITQGWLNCLTGVAMTLMEWYPFLVYYKITESLFVFWFIFIVGHHPHLCLMIYKLPVYSPNIPHGIISPGNPQKLDLSYQ